MSNVIKSGDSGNTAKVDDSGRLATFAVTQTEEVATAREGQAFLVTHPLVELTDSTESFVFYCKNDDIVPWILEFLSRTVIGATGGTLLTGTDGAAINLSVGAPNILPVTVKAGAQGATATGGASLFPSIVVKDQMTAPFIGGPVILPPSTSFAYAVTPPAGNTSLKVKLNMLAFRDLEK